MTQAKAIYHNAPMSPRKIQPILQLLRGLPVKQAQAQLEYIPGKAARIIQQVLKSAVANAIANNDLDEHTLTIFDISVSKGLVMKRWQPAAKGMAHPILKRMAHVAVVVTGEPTGKPTQKKRRAAAISTISVDEYASRTHANEEPEHEHGYPTANLEKGPSQVTPAEVQNAQSQEAFQKTKIQQQGGDKRKSFRRKSI